MRAICSVMALSDRQMKEVVYQEGKADNLPSLTYTPRNLDAVASYVAVAVSYRHAKERQIAHARPGPAHSGIPYRLSPSMSPCRYSVTGA